MSGTSESMESEWESLEPLGNPFSTDAVDPLVYTHDDTSPELRAAAAYIPVAPKLTIRESAPVKPQPRTHSVWTPGGDNVTIVPADTKTSFFPRFVKGTVSSILIAAPLIAVGLAIWVALNLYQ